jgi:hypothetical protein
LKGGAMKLKGLTDEQSQHFEKMWDRYHEGGLKDLPTIVYFDVGWMMGLIMQLVQDYERVDYDCGPPDVLPGPDFRPKK